MGSLILVFFAKVELWVQVLLMCSQFACILSVIALGLYVRTNRGYSGLVPGGSPLGRILVERGTYGHYQMSKDVLVYYCNTV